MTEVELKLLCPPELMAQAAKAPALQQRLQGGLKEKLLDATYYDTLDAALARRKWALRMRREGDEGHVLTLKRPVASGDGGLGRAEWNLRCPDERLDRSQVARWLAEAGAEEIDVGALAPMFRTVVRRSSGFLEHERGVVEVACDTGEIIAGGRSEPISEIELEMTSGSPEAMFDIASSLVRDLDLRVAVHSKAARGYDMALALTPPAVKFRMPALAPYATLDAALHVWFAAIYAHLIANLAPVSAGCSPEGVHQLRVALRRLRALMSFVNRMSPATGLDGLRGDAAWLMGSLGDTRNLDVLASGVVRDAAGDGVHEADFASLQERLQQLRADASEQMLAALHSPRANLFLLSLGGWIARAGWRDGVSGDASQRRAAAAATIADAELRRLRQRTLRKGRGFRDLDAHGLHEVRLALKKLRYLDELFHPLLDEERAGRRQMRRLARLQDEFGRFNDMQVAMAILARLHGATGRRAAGETFACGVAWGWARRAAMAARRDLHGRWREFRKATRRLL